MIRRRAFLAGAALLPSSAARALSGEATVLSGDRFRMGEETYRLADIRAPSPYDLYREHEPFHEPSKAMLRAMLAASPVENPEAALAQNRWGLTPVVARRKEAVQSLQGELVARGAARVWPETDRHDEIDVLLALEEKARRAREGLWGLDFYRVWPALGADDAIGAFHLIEGALVDAADRSGRIYLNFGDDYRTDFTTSADGRRTAAILSLPQARACACVGLWPISTARP